MGIKLPAHNVDIVLLNDHFGWLRSSTIEVAVVRGVRVKDSLAYVHTVFHFCQLGWRGCVSSEVAQVVRLPCKLSAQFDPLPFQQTGPQVSKFTLKFLVCLVVRGLPLELPRLHDRTGISLEHRRRPFHGISCHKLSLILADYLVGVVVGRGVVVGLANRLVEILIVLEIVLPVGRLVVPLDVGFWTSMFPWVRRGVPQLHISQTHFWCRWWKVD